MYFMNDFVESKVVSGLSSSWTIFIDAAAVPKTGTRRLAKVLAKRRMVSAVLCAGAAVDVGGLTLRLDRVDGLGTMPVEAVQKR